ncbi:MAG: hypothetical protein AAGA25_13270, partial [Planctomycetota bacterium]
MAKLEGPRDRFEDERFLTICCEGSRSQNRRLIKGFKQFTASHDWHTASIGYTNTLKNKDNHALLAALSLV